MQSAIWNSRQMQRHQAIGSEELMNWTNAGKIPERSISKMHQSFSSCFSLLLATIFPCRLTTTSLLYLTWLLFVQCHTPGWKWIFCSLSQANYELIQSCEREIWRLWKHHSAFTATESLLASLRNPCKAKQFERILRYILRRPGYIQKSPWVCRSKAEKDTWR